MFDDGALCFAKVIAGIEVGLWSKFQVLGNISVMVVGFCIGGSKF